MNFVNSSLLLFLVAALAGLSHVQGYCGVRMFTCQSDNECIPHTWTCDGQADCEDGSDENDCAPRECDASTQFRCSNGTRCVPLRWECDGENDCPDASDEDPAKCQLKTCNPDQFSCGVGQPCIPSTWQCDTHEDCPNGEDENNCPDRSCVAEEYQCQNGACITMRWLCDGDNDCGDHSDELNCAPPTCPPGEFLCGGNSSRCIPELWRCDGDRDCVDNSDEADCKQSPVPNARCSSTEFMCENYECIHKDWQCDGEVDCVDGSDEQECHQTCRSDQFVCDNGQCIRGTLECDGFSDCTDGSDEGDKCSPLVHQCSSDEFDCALDGTNCIPKSLVCDKINNCGQGEDERDEICLAENPCLTNNGGCDHLCVKTLRDYHCECNPGYKLAADDKTCMDVNECDISGMCSQDCKNTIGSFQCWCRDGYARDPHDHRLCRVIDNEPHLLFSNRYDMRKMGLHSGEYHSVLEKLKAAIGVDYDYAEQKVYYTDVALEHIMVADLIDGQVNDHPAVLLRNHINTPDGLALDWIHKNLYWTDTGMDSIEVMALSSSQRKTLFNTGLDEPRAIVVDPRDNQGWIYWTDWGNVPKIERAGMDGSSREVIVDKDIKWPNGLTIDYTMDRLFWVDAKLHLIGSSDLAGMNRQVIITSATHLRHPFAITVFEDWLYWSDWETESISSVRKFMNSTHTNEVSSKVLGLQSPMDVRVFHPFKQPAAENRCGTNNGGCSHLCLPHPRHSLHSAGMTCQCPNGMKLQEDNLQTCYTVMTAKPNYRTTERPVTAESGVTQSGEFSTKATKKSEDIGKIAGIVVGIISALVLITAVIGYFVYRSIISPNSKSLNFDNPVYRKTTEDTFSLEKHQYQPSKTLPPTLEPLTTENNYEYV